MENNNMFLNNLKKGIAFILPALLDEAYPLHEYNVARWLLTYAVDKTPIDICDQYSYRSMYKMYMTEYNNDIWRVLSDKNIEEEARKHMLLLYLKENDTDIKEIEEMINEVEGHSDSVFMYDLLTKSSIRLENYVEIFPRNAKDLCGNDTFVSLYTLYCYKNGIPKPPYLKSECGLNIYSLMAYTYDLVTIKYNYAMNENIILYSLYQDENKRKEMLHGIKNKSLSNIYHIARLTNEPAYFLENKAMLRNSEYTEANTLSKYIRWVVNKTDIAESLKRDCIIGVFNCMEEVYGVRSIVKITGYYEGMDDKIKQLPPDSHGKYEIICTVVEKHPEKESELVPTLSKPFIIRYLEEYGYNQKLFELAKDCEEAREYIQKNIDRVTL